MNWVRTWGHGQEGFRAAPPHPWNFIRRPPQTNTRKQNSPKVPMMPQVHSQITSAPRSRQFKSFPTALLKPRFLFFSFSPRTFVVFLNCRSSPAGWQAPPPPRVPELKPRPPPSAVSQEEVQMMSIQRIAHSADYSTRFLLFCAALVLIGEDSSQRHVTIVAACCCFKLVFCDHSSFPMLVECVLIRN